MANDNGGDSSEEGDSSLMEDLQRCRRLVAVMRGQVLASSVKQQVLKELVVAVQSQQRSQALKLRKQHQNRRSLSPRELYRRKFDIDRIRSIQKRWRRYLLQKRITAKLRMEQKWRHRQGDDRHDRCSSQSTVARELLAASQRHIERTSIAHDALTLCWSAICCISTPITGLSRFRASAVKIQRVVRGYSIRKHRHDTQTLLERLQGKRRASRLERLRAQRIAHRTRCENHERDVRKVQLDLEATRATQLCAEKAVASSASQVVVDATLVDGTAVRMEAVQLASHCAMELKRLEAFATLLEKVKVELTELEPVLHRAATTLQALYRGFRSRRERKQQSVRRRQAFTRMLQSKEACYERMYALWQVRNQRQWEVSARTIAGIYYIQQAKIQRVNLRQVRAATQIVRLYRDNRARVAAKKRLGWKRIKFRAREMLARRLRAWLKLTWTAWELHTRDEVQRQVTIVNRETAGVAAWQQVKAAQFLTVYRKRVALRRRLERKALPGLDAALLCHIRAAVQVHGGTSRLEISSAFFLLVRQDVWAWQCPDKQLYFLARRYNLPLDRFPLEHIRTWLSEAAPTFVDLKEPLPTQTLQVLRHLSQFFELHSRVLMQTQRVCSVYEARVVIREYLSLLHSSNLVRTLPSRTFSAHQRQRILQFLRAKDVAEYLSTEMWHSQAEPKKQQNVARGAFSSFHCLWNGHLCERCLMLQLHRHEDPTCKSCGHHRYEDATVTRSLRLELIAGSGKPCAETVAASAPKTTQKQWVSLTERLDFVVLNAVFHAVAPIGHPNREDHAPETLWKLALANSNALVAGLYERLPSGSLNDLLNASCEEIDAWTDACCTELVAERVRLFIFVLKDEWAQLDVVETQAYAEDRLLPERQQIQAKIEPSRAIGSRRSSKYAQKYPPRRIQASERLQPLLRDGCAANWHDNRT